MGLGKTVQSISMLAYLRQFRDIKGPHLVVVPLTCLGNWVNEFTQWCPDINICRFHGDKVERKRLMEEVIKPGEFDCVLTSYEMVIKEKGPFSKIPWRYIIVDEAHRLKNENSLLSQVLRSFQSTNRLLLTGTPLQNNLHELWALLNFLVPEIFGSADDFDDMFNMEDSGKQQNILGQLAKILRPFMLRRLKKDVEKSLPPKTETLVLCGMSKVQKKVYTNVLKREKVSLFGGAQNKKLLNIVMQLRKAANHPYLFDGVEDRSLPPYGEHLIENCGKLVVLDKLLFKLKSRQSRVLIFSQMTRALDILEDYCIARQFQYCRIDGSTDTMTREEHIKEYNRPGSEKFVFLLSTRSGGLGINLYTADIVILYDSDWNPQMDLQAMDRAHRIGQKKPVFVYRMVTEDTIEEKIIERANIKLRLDAMVVQQGRLSSSKKISKDEMASMIQYGADNIFRSKDVSSITDDDIDKILSRGQQRTKEMNDKLDKLRPEGNTESSNIWSLDGVDYRTQNAEKLKAHIEDALVMDLHPGKRERKSRIVYNVDDYFREKIQPKKFECLIQKPTKAPKMIFYQMYDEERIEKLCADEQEFYQRYQFAKKPPRLTGLSEEEMKEREDLLAAGFKDWSRKDYFNFLDAMKKYGRDNIKKIALALPSRSEEEVARYSKAFWSRSSHIPNIKKHLKAIERAESKLKRNEELSDLLTDMLKEYPTQEDVMNKMELKLRTALADKGYSTLSDKFLLSETRRLGYGDFEKLKKNIAVERMFLFDYFFRTRDTWALQRRVDALIMSMQKDREIADRERKRKLSHLQKKAEKAAEAKAAKEAAAAAAANGTDADAKAASTASPSTKTEEPAAKKLKV